MPSPKERSQIRFVLYTVAELEVHSAHGGQTEAKPKMAAGDMQGDLLLLASRRQVRVL
ncbi:MAG TPA: hypothetical protein VLY63_23890 [Anaerolineae bacterium]|nr:hypothetical protein [Anaerolineae bacterium]